MADKDFARVRNEFVKRVSKETLIQLLEELITEHVFSDLEKESILEENSSRVDRARSFADTLKKKGEKSCRKMFIHLQTIDETLFSELGLSSAEPAQSSAEPAQSAVKPPEVPQEQKWSSSLVPCTDAFIREIQDKHIYPVSRTSKANRVALLITNKNFQHASTREGAEKDELQMERLLISLKYEVVKYRDQSAKEIKEALVKFSKHPKLTSTDSVFVVLMSHGKLGALLGGGRNKDSDWFNTDQIYEILNTKSCPTLLNKPKIIIIQGCRGVRDGSVELPDMRYTQVQTDAVEHKEKDFLTLLSCTPNTVSYRLPEYGSFLIQYIVQVFNTLACKDDIEELFRKVMHRFEEYNPYINCRQMPTKDRCTLTKLFFLFPEN